jgi:ubiquinone/menaquinone biosynthesis C-methylase UbiE
MNPVTTQKERDQIYEAGFLKILHTYCLDFADDKIDFVKAYHTLLVPKVVLDECYRILRRQKCIVAIEALTPDEKEQLKADTRAWCQGYDMDTEDKVRAARHVHAITFMLNQMASKI